MHEMALSAFGAAFVRAFDERFFAGLLVILMIFPLERALAVLAPRPFETVSVCVCVASISAAVVRSQAHIGEGRKRTSGKVASAHRGRSQAHIGEGRKRTSGKVASAHRGWGGLPDPDTATCHPQVLFHGAAEHHHTTDLRAEYRLVLAAVEMVCKFRHLAGPFTRQSV
jgi:hypothetical protein